MTARGRLAGVLLTIGSVLGTLCLASVLAAVAFGVKPLIVQSGSMAPGMPTGSLALARSVPADEVEVGDVVSVVARSGVRVTHRVVDIASSSTGSQRALSLQGDANSTPDAAPYVVDTVDRVLVDAPELGYAIAWLSGPGGRFASGALVGVIVVLAWPRRAERPPAPRHLAPRLVHAGRRRVARTVVASLLAVALVGGTDVATARPAMAAFGDTGTVTSGTFGAYTVPAPSLTCNITGNILFGQTAHIRWTPATLVHTPTYTARIVNTNAPLTPVAVGGDLEVTVTSGLLGTLLGVRVTIEVTAHAPGPGAWSTASTKQVDRALLGLGVSCVS